MGGHCKTPNCEHQAPSGDYNRVDYAEKMDDLIFSYDKDFYPDDAELPDPQVNPIIPGSKVPLQKVGIAPVDLPIKVLRRDGEQLELQDRARSARRRPGTPRLQGHPIRS